MSRPKLFIFGSCDLHDIVQNDVLHKDFQVISSHVDQPYDNSSVNINEHGFPTNGTSLLSLYTNPSFVAQRVMDTWHNVSKHERLLYNGTYKEIIKYPYFDFYRKYAGPDDYLVLSFSAELYTKFAKLNENNEIFTCLPLMHYIFDESNCLHWLYKEFLSKEELLLPFDTKESLEQTYDLLVDFARDIHSIFEDRVILVKTHFSHLVLGENLKVTAHPFGPKDLLFYRQTRIATDPTDHNYAERLSDIIMNKFKHHYSSDIPVIRLTEPVFLDANHPWGFSQFHLDPISRQKIATLISTELMKHRNKHLHFNPFRTRYEINK